MAVEKNTIPLYEGVGLPGKACYFICDTEAEKPSSMRIGDLALAKDSGKLYRAITTSSWTEVGGGGSSGPWTRVSLPADVTNNNATLNTLQDVTGLSFPVTAGLRYWFRFWIVYTAAATTTGSRWTINGPATTGLGYMSEYSLTGTTTTRNAMVIAYNSPAASNLSSAATGPSNIARIEGFVQPSANGTIIARFASEIANSAIVAKVGSFVEYTVVP